MALPNYHRIRFYRNKIIEHWDGYEENLNTAGTGFTYQVGIQLHWGAITGWPTDPIDKEFHAALFNWLKFHQAILIGELVPEALRYLRNNPTAPELSAFDHVVVDEYQDLNKADQELIDLLSANAESLVIGDVDQSIYSFRHAHPEGIKDYHLSHTDTHDESLDECRRCPTKIVELADNLIKQNYPPGGAPRLRPLSSNPGGEVHIVQWGSPTEEIDGVCKFISHLIKDRGYTPSEILVLSHRRKFGYELKDKLNDLSVLAHSYFPERMLHDKEIQLAFTKLILLARPEDRVSLRFWLASDSANCNKTPYRTLREYCEKTGLSPRDALIKAAKGENIGKVAKLVVKFEELEKLRTELSALTVTEVFDRLFPETEAWAQEVRIRIRDKVKNDLPIEGLASLVETTVMHPDPPDEDVAVRIMSLTDRKD